MALACLGMLSACNDPASQTSASAVEAPQANARPRALAVPAGWVNLPAEPDATLQGLNIPADAPTRGMWSGSRPWPFNAIHAVLLSDGRVLTFGTLYGIPDSQDGRFFDVWTPELGFGDDAHAGNVTPDAVNSFCGSVGWLTDGSLLVAGGNGGGGSPQFGKTAGTFSMSTYKTTQNGASFAAERWYSTMLMLPDTRQIIIGGTVPYASPITSQTPEILENGAWRSLFGASSTAIFGVRALGNQPEANPWYYPRAWVAPDGNIVGITSNILFRLDPDANNRNGSIQQIGTFKTVQDPTGTTTPNVGFTSTAVMYAPGKILQVGGNGTTDNNGLTASQNASVIDINGATPVVTETAPMSFRRHWANSVVLPDGKVVVTGGTTVGWDPANAVRAAELWNPDTGTWTVGASAAETRTYHSSSVLLPSGVVFTSGGGAPGAVNNRNTELYYPPYLFTTVNGQAQLAARPRIAGISALQGNWGGTLGLEMAAAGGVSKVVLIQTGTTTHSFDSTQRLVPLTFTQNGTTVTANIPANANLAPPGYYMVFVVDAAGVPSRGVIISLGGLKAPSATRPDIPSALPSNAVLCAQEGGTCTLPGGLRGTVYYGARGIFASRAGVTGSLACNNGVLGDPVAVVKQCFYVPEGPAGSRFCAAEGGNCQVAPGFTAALSYGANGSYATLQAQTGTVACNAGRFGSDPAPGLTKSCFIQYAATAGTPPPPPPPPPPATTTPPATATTCGTEGQLCSLPAGSTATVWFGADTRWVSRTDLTGSLPCNADTFGDPAVGVVKSCRYQVTSALPPSGGGTAPAGLAGAWSLDALTGGVTADSSGNNCSLTVTGAASVAGRIGQGLQFNGTNASGSTAGPVVDTAASFTVAAWVKLDALNEWRTFVNQDGAVVSGFWLQYSQWVGNKFLLTMHDADSNTSTPFRAVGTTTPVVGQWYHVTGVRDRAAGTMKIFVNGRLEGTTAYTGGWAANGSLNIGRGKFNGPGDWLPGTLDQVKAYRRALTDAEVAALAASEGVSGVTPPPPTPGPITIAAISAPVISAGATASYTPALNVPGAVYSWNFGDGSAPTAESASPNATRAFANAGVYTVTLNVRLSDGSVQQKTFLQAVVNAATARAGVSSTGLTVENRAGASARLWVVNPDNDSVSVIDTATNARVAEVAVGRSPRAVAVAGDGRVWVSNKDSASISILNPATLAVVQTVNLPTASRPHGLAFAPGGSAFVVLEGAGRLLKLDPVSGAVQGDLVVGPNVRHVSLSGDGALALVPRFITPALPGESTAVVNTAAGGGEVLAVNAGPMTLNRTIGLRHSDKVDTEAQGAGIPNYLGAAAISPDGRSAWVPSKQDNIRRGTLRNGQALDFQNTVRAISSRIDLGTLAEDHGRRIDHDNASLGSAALHHPSGAYLFVALETSRQVAIHDATTGRQLARIDVGLAPQSLAVTANGRTLAVQNFMGRTVSVVDLTALVSNGELRLPVAATVGTVGVERLAANVLRGKQFFHDARDPRLARDSYMSCASCHSEAGHDGRTWDFTGFGEGLRNTPSLKGRAGTGQGFVHWSANFDEIQDFEGQIRAFAGGTGLMSDAQFNTGTRNTPLGERKTGVSADLDALAAYLGSLNSFDRSPARNADGSLTAAALAGKAVFTNANCASCHGGTAFSGSGDATALKNIGTLKPASGQRLNGALTGLDVPTLRDVWQSGPYLHDGSAGTLAAAVQAHQGNTVAGADLSNLVAYLQQIGGDEPAPASPPTGTGNGTGLRASYFGNATLSGTAVVTRTEAPWFDWGVGAPAAGIGADNFSVRWTGELQAVEAGTYQLRTLSDDGVRVWVSGVQVINNWTVHAPTVDASAGITLAAGQRVPITVEFQEFSGGALLQLSWLRPGGSWAPVPVSNLHPSAVPSSVPPATAVTCANEGGVCTLPAGVSATVWYGTGTSWAVRPGVSGSLACTNAVFGDPLRGTAKSCRYQR